MLKIYHQTDTKLGYIYFSGTGDNYMSELKTFDDKYKLKSFLTGLEIESFLFDFEAFLVTFHQSEKCSTHLEEKSFMRLDNYLKMVNEKDYPKEKLKKDFDDMKEEFTTILKASKATREKLFMLYKSMKEL